MPTSDLIGIPWGFGAGETNCVDLMYRYFGRENPWKYDPGNYLEESEAIPERIASVMGQVDEPGEGVVGVVKIGRCHHLLVFVDRIHILHVFEGDVSRISRYTEAYRKRTVGLYRWKEVGQWPEQQ